MPRDGGKLEVGAENYLLVYRFLIKVLHRRKNHLWFCEIEDQETKKIYYFDFSTTELGFMGFRYEA